MNSRDRYKLVRSKNLCYRCLSGGHQIKDCDDEKGECTVEGCDKLHHRLLHFTELRDKSPSKENDPNAVCSVVDATVARPKVSGLSIYLNVVPVVVNHGEKRIATYAFLDPGSSNSFCEKKLVDKLGAVGSPKSINIQTLTGPQMLDTVAVSVSVEPVRGGYRLDLTEVVAIDEIPVKPNAVPCDDDRMSHSYLRGVDLPEVEGATVTLMIGANNPEALRVEAVRKGNGHCPDAVRTPLGWLLLGPAFDSTNPDENENGSSFCVAHVGAHAVLETAQALFLSDESDALVDSVEVDENTFDNTASSLSREDRRTYSLMSQSIEFVDGHYQLPLPWRPDFQVLPNNLKTVEKRLMGLKRHLLKDPEIREKYVEQMRIMIEKGYTEKVPEGEIQTRRRTWYIPHRGVVIDKSLVSSALFLIVRQCTRACHLAKY